MKIIFPLTIYEWLKYLQILPSNLPSISEMVQIPTNQAIYIQNGYLIGKTLKKVIATDTKQYQMLLKVRQITVLQVQENWSIIKLVMQNLGFQIDFLDQVDEQVILEMLEFLYQKYAPPQVQKQFLKRKKISFQFDIVHFDHSKQINQSKNLLQFMVCLTRAAFSIRVDQALGLIINKCIWLKRLIKFGTIANDYEEVKYFYDLFFENYQIFQALVNQEEMHLGFVLEGLGDGVLSESQEVCIKSLQIYNRMKDKAWMKQEGFKKLMMSEHKEAFNFLLQNAYPRHKELFNQNLPLFFKKKEHFLSFILRLLKNLPKSLYGKQIIEIVSFDFYIERTLQFLDPQQDQPEELRQLSRNILMTAILHYQGKISITNLKRILKMGFHFQPNTSLKESLSLISALFEILQHLMLSKSGQTQNYFKTALSYVQLGNREISHFALQNFNNLYVKLRGYFPVKFFLSFYPYEMRITQNIDYQILSLIVNSPQLTIDQVQICLDICFYYFLKEIHCECFLDLINILLRRKSGDWVTQHLSEIFMAWKELHPEGLNSNKPIGNIKVSDKKKGSKGSKQFASIGVKRKEMLKVKEYQNFCNALTSFLQVPSKKILHELMNHTKKYLSQFDKKPEKQISIIFLKDLEKKIGMAIDNFKQSTHSYNLVQNKVQLTESQMIQNYSMNRQKLRLVAKRNAGNSNASVNPNPGQLLKESTRKQQESLYASQISQRNQFMSLTGFVVDKHEGSEVQGSQKEYNPLLPFQQFDKIQTNVIYYSKDLLQQYEIVYLDLLFQKYELLIDKIVYIYQKCEDLESLLKNMDILRLTPLEEAEQVWIKAKAKNFETDKELIKDFIIQISMLVFTFEKNKAPQISCVESFMKRLDINVQRKNAKALLQGFQASQKQKKRKSYQISKQLKFSSKSSSKYHVDEKYLICLKILNEIIEGEFSCNLIQLMSQVVNKVNTPSLWKQQLGKTQQGKIKDADNEKQQEDMQEMLKQFEQKTKEVQIRKIKKTITPKPQENFHEAYLNNSIIKLGVQKSRNALLREKISLRKQEVQKKLKAMKGNPIQKEQIIKNEQSKQRPIQHEHEKINAD